MEREHDGCVKKGIGLGIVSGMMFGIMEMAGAAMMGNPAVMPLRMFASTVLGRAALEATPLGTAVAVGIIAHLVLSSFFGLIYALIVSGLSREARTSWGKQAAAAIGFGAALWLVNFRIIGRLLYPWFLMTPQFLQMMMHALFFGLPLGLLHAGIARRAAKRRGTTSFPKAA